ncbi:Splicing factor, arginine/serine-rich 17A [Camponotus floridanus]|uniref:Splicing factor, arginine/serine-rich 17A n=1 Tax=Camponotus floridanus TaxID=104421 RepID=E2B1E8_CAMFO|nr:Splicing factor, arginine/serine-rich 17A [Camponotus floridanus]
MSDNKQVGEKPSSEVANRFGSCRDLSDIVPLYPPRLLYLKPLAKVNVSVSLPQLKTPGKTISTWDVMEKIRALILPDEFASLKVAKSSLEFIRLEGDLRDRCRLPKVLARLDSQRLNLSGFPTVLKVRAAEAKDDFPTRHSWDSYFRDAKHMNELKPGERPDTIHITGLPVKWFIEDDASVPSESLICKIFKKWGPVRKIDVPVADPYRSRMRLGSNIHKFSYEDGIFFDAFIQYNEYMDFVRAMDALRGMKLLKKDDQNSLTATIKVDFDKTKHMSDNSISHREFERKRLIAQDNLAVEKLRRKEEAEKKRREEQKKKEEADSIEKVSRQRKREEKRKRKVLTTYRKQEEDKVSMKIAREEKKLIKAQRQLESIRLLDELFDRIKIKVENNEIKLNQSISAETKKDEKKNDQVNESVNKLDSENDKKIKEKQTKKKKAKKEKKKKKKRKKSQKKRKRNDGSDSDSTEEETNEETNKKKLKSVLIKNDHAPSSTGAIVPTGNLPYAHSYSDSRMPMLPPIATGPFHALRISLPRYPGAQMLRPPMPSYPLIHHHPMLPMGRGRRYNPRFEMNSYALTNPYLYNGEYYEYFTHLVDRDSQRQESRIHGRRKSRSRSISKRRTKSRSKTKSRSVSRSRSARRSDSRSKSRRSKSGSRSRSRRSKSSRSRSRSRSRGRRKSTSRSVSRRRTRSNSRSKRKSGTRSRSRSKSSSRRRSRSRSRRRSRSRSRSKSRSSLRTRYKKRRGRRSASVVKVTRAKSRSPRRKSRSSSWSMPKSPDRRSCSWSRTVPANNINEQNVSETSNKGIQEKATKTTEVQEEAK